MKKGLYGFTAFVMALTLVGCGADKNKSSDKESKSSKATALSDEKNDTKTDTKKSEKSKSAANIPDIKTYAGEYRKNGHGSWGDLPDDLKPDNIEEALKKDPMTISEDGILHFCGQDYKLVAEGEDDGANIYSVEGSDFDFNKYCKSSSKYVAKNYEGPVFITEEETHMTFNGEDVSYVNLLLYITPKGDTSCPEYISFELKNGDDDDDWSSDWDWDDWDDDSDWDWDDEDESTEEENNNTNNDRARKQISFG